MKQFLKILFNKKLFIIFSLIICFLSGYLTCFFINNENAYYSASFTVSNENYDINNLSDIDYLNSIKQSGFNATTNVNKYENIDVEKMISNDDFNVEYKDNIYTIKTGYKYYDIFFIKSSASVSTRAKMFIKDAVSNNVRDENIVITFENSKDIVTLNNFHNTWLFGLYFSLAGFALLLIYLIVIYLKKVEINDNNFEYDNVNVYRTIFHKSYWKAAFKPFRKVKDMTLLAMIFALMMAAKFVALPSGFGNLGLGFTYLFFATIGMIYGPAYGFLIGFLSDFVGFYIKPTGMPFYLGYSLQAAMTGFIYGICFFKTKVNFSKVLLSRIIVGLFMNVIVGSLCWIRVTTMGDGVTDFNQFMTLTKSYALLIALPKNIVYLLPQSILLFAVFKGISPILYRYKLIDQKVYKHLNVLS